MSESRLDEPGPYDRVGRITEAAEEAEEAGAGAPRVVGLLLAAGGGRRLGGRPKALLPYRGRPLVEHAVEVLRTGGCAEVHVVIGAAADRVREEASLDGCVLVENPEWEQGMGSSLRAGLDSLRGSGAEAALVSLVDQPGIGAEAVARVVAAHTSPKSLVCAAYTGRRGHPVLFGSERWAGIAATATGDRGARAYLKEHEADITRVECADVAEAFDIDTEADLVRLR
ncbi:nucleotidyltransferase family protein [Streptomyces cavernicola]|uniref:Nucleotidyltransferase family protein n=1 Tax=Streptomyces cavernicola TaxID=3043613 RepID=A0ABT6SAT1_9ACTN|nr:nucleotidyltransferase family protein [Streptomyces sp. B-S-A6]MDI3405305.1 nucleotidyltransferase family protein [Streptomyces sp. B-S-A6]